jgi:hypothetical protein
MSYSVLTLRATRDLRLRIWPLVFGLIRSQMASPLCDIVAHIVREMLVSNHATCDAGTTGCVYAAA